MTELHLYVRRLSQKLLLSQSHFEKVVCERPCEDTAYKIFQNVFLFKYLEEIHEHIDFQILCNRKMLKEKKTKPFGTIAIEGLVLQIP